MDMGRGGWGGDEKNFGFASRVSVFTGSEKGWGKKLRAWKA